MGGIRRAAISSVNLPSPEAEGLKAEVWASTWLALALPEIDCLESHSIDERRVRAGIGARRVSDLADIDLVGQQMINSPAGKGAATKALPLSNRRYLLTRPWRSAASWTRRAHPSSR
jgi:hypothetical protein